MACTVFSKSFALKLRVGAESHRAVQAQILMGLEVPRILTRESGAGSGENRGPQWF